MARRNRHVIRSWSPQRYYKVLPVCVGVCVQRCMSAVSMHELAIFFQMEMPQGGHCLDQAANPLRTTQESTLCVLGVSFFFLFSSFLYLLLFFCLFVK